MLYLIYFIIGICFGFNYLGWISVNKSNFTTVDKFFGASIVTLLWPVVAAAYILGAVYQFGKKL